MNSLGIDAPQTGDVVRGPLTTGEVERLVHEVATQHRLRPTHSDTGLSPSALENEYDPAPASSGALVAPIGPTLSPTPSPPLPSRALTQRASLQPSATARTRSATLASQASSARTWSWEDRYPW